MSPTKSERWKFWSVVACLMGATGVLVTAPLDAASAQERAVPKQDIILGSDARNGKHLFAKRAQLLTEELWLLMVAHDIPVTAREH